MSVLPAEPSFRRVPFLRADVESVIEFCLAHGAPYDGALLRRLLLDLTSAAAGVSIVADRAGAVLVSTVIDRADNGADAASFEILGVGTALPSEAFARLAVEPSITFARAGARRALHVALHESLARVVGAGAALRAAGFKPSYLYFTLRRSTDGRRATDGPRRALLDAPPPAPSDAPPPAPSGALPPAPSDAPPPAPSDAPPPAPSGAPPPAPSDTPPPAPSGALPPRWRWADLDAAHAPAAHAALMEMFRGQVSFSLSPLPHFRQVLATGTAQWRVLYDGDVIAGLVQVVLDAQHGELRTVGRAPAYRGLGLGARLVAEGLRLLEEGGAHEIELNVEANNEGALRLYRRFGFKVARRTPVLALELR